MQPLDEALRSLTDEDWRIIRGRVAETHVLWSGPDFDRQAEAYEVVRRLKEKGWTPTS